MSVQEEELSSDMGHDMVEELVVVVVVGVVAVPAPVCRLDAAQLVRHIY